MTLNLRQKLRAIHVKRWHIVEVSRPQSVAEHSFNVYLISMEILDKLGPNTTATMEAVRAYALHHDLPEVVTGDIPTPTKSIISTKLLDTMNEMDPQSIPPSDDVYNIIKLADTLEAILYITTYGVGRHAKLVRNKLVGAADDMMHGVFKDSSANLDKFFESFITWETEYDDDRGVLWQQK